jgi:hypothetical protein
MTTATCPDLRALAGDTYRVTWETPLGQRPTPMVRRTRGHAGALRGRGASLVTCGFYPKRGSGIIAASRCFPRRYNFNPFG